MTWNVWGRSLYLGGGGGWGGHVRLNLRTEEEWRWGEGGRYGGLTIRYLQEIERGRVGMGRGGGGDLGPGWGGY